MLAIHSAVLRFLKNGQRHRVGVLDQVHQVTAEGVGQPDHDLPVRIEPHGVLAVAVQLHPAQADGLGQPGRGDRCPVRFSVAAICSSILKSTLGAVRRQLCLLMFLHAFVFLGLVEVHNILAVVSQFSLAHAADLSQLV